MDSRGTSAVLVADPHGQCERLAARTGIAVPHIAEARHNTRMRIAELREALSTENLTTGFSICVFGSWAREELTPNSDDDWAVLAAEPFAMDNPNVSSAMIIAERRLGEGDQAPGTQSIFGMPFDAPGLINNVGLDADTNTNLTRRMLLLLESQEVAGTVHADVWQSVLTCYLNYGVKDYGTSEKNTQILVSQNNNGRHFAIPCRGGGRALQAAYSGAAGGGGARMARDRASCGHPRGGCCRGCRDFA
jgi:hypothetical protein